MIAGVGEHRAVRPDDPFGPAGGPRGEHYVGGLRPCHLGGPVVRRRFGGQRGDERLVDDDAHRGLVQNVGDPVGGHRGVQRHDDRARLQHAQHRDDVVGAAGQGDRHGVFVTDPAGEQRRGHPVSGLVELAIGQPSGVPGQRYRPEARAGDLGEPSVHPAAADCVTGG